MRKQKSLIDCRDSELGQLLKAMRCSKGLNQDELGKHIGVGRTSVTNMERGRQIVTLLHLVKAGEACGFDVRLRVEKAKRGQK